MRTSFGFLTAVLTFGILSAYAPQARAEDRIGGGGVLVAKAGKKKKKAKEEDDFGPPEIQAIDDNDSGVGVHREQTGVDTPYKSEVNGRGDIGFLSRKTGDGTAEPSTAVNIEGAVMFIISRFEAGPEIGLSYFAEKTTQSVTTGTGAAAVTTSKSVDATATGVSLGGVFKVNFANIDHALLVPFAYGGVAYLMNSTKAGDADAAKETGFAVKAGGGLNIFLTSNVAINPGIEYKIQTTKADTDGAKENSLSGLHLLGGFAIFL